MNPEKYSEHTALNHSVLWRKPQIFEKDVPLRPKCHKQVNDLAMTGVSWRSRNNFIHTNFSGLNLTNSTIYKNPSFMRASRASNNVLSQHKDSEQTKNLKQSISSNMNVINKSALLIKGMQDLKRKGLLSAKDLHKVNYPGNNKKLHIYNDYHERVTNPGFSRNHSGKHFMK